LLFHHYLWPLQNSDEERFIDLQNAVRLSSRHIYDIMEAALSDMGDFEDAVAAVCAARVQADFFVSRDRDFARAGGAVPVLAPALFLEKEIWMAIDDYMDMESASLAYFSRCALVGPCTVYFLVISFTPDLLFRTLLAMIIPIPTLGAKTGTGIKV
jgi:hypothetical protein